MAARRQGGLSAWLPRDLHWRRGAFWLMVFMALLSLTATIVIVSGAYNVAASVTHFTVTEKLITFALRRSVAVRAREELHLADADDSLVRLGARHYRFGCAPCHGDQAGPGNPLVAGMYPAPPSLGRATLDWSDGELVWIVRHGFKFTGMPAWSGAGRRDEVFPLVAFLHRLPGLTATDYAELTSGPVQYDAPPHLRQMEISDYDQCVACHGDESEAPVAGLVPALSGQSESYLRRALNEYRDDRRQSGMMEPIAAALGDEKLEELARRFARQRPASPRASAREAEVRRGATIARAGLVEQSLPACLACHSESASAQFPRLAGLSHAYIRRQLQLFREGQRSETGYAAIMSAIARRLTTAQAGDAAAYFASLGPPSKGPTAAASP